MAKARPKASAKAKAKPKASPPPEPAAEPPAIEPAALPDERQSRRGTIVAVVIALACTAATALLLSGWTPGPGQNAPPRIAARTAPAAPVAPKKKVTPKKAVKPTPRKTTKRPARITQRAFAEELFVGECGICHTLAAARTNGTAGPNLDKLRPSRTRVLDAIAAGGRRTGLMPPGILTGADATRVAKFVSEATRR